MASQNGAYYRVGRTIIGIHQSPPTPLGPYYIVLNREVSYCETSLGLTKDEQETNCDLSRGLLAITNRFLCPVFGIGLPRLTRIQVPHTHSWVDHLWEYGPYSNLSRQTKTRSVIGPEPSRWSFDTASAKPESIRACLIPRRDAKLASSSQQ